MGDNRLKQWAQARMTAETWSRLTGAVATGGQNVQRVAGELRVWLSIDSDRVTSFRTARVEPWRLVFAIVVAAVPMLLLAALPLTIPAGVIIAILLAIILLSTYAADWVGGLTSLLTGFVALEFFFLGERGRFDFWEQGSLFWVAAVYMLAGGAAIIMMEHLKHELALARAEAKSLRAANTAFYSMEIAAAQRPAGDSAAFVEVMQRIITVMVRVNRASAGAIYLVDRTRNTLVRAVVYGGDDEVEVTPDGTPDGPGATVRVDEGFVGRVYREQRPLVVYDTYRTEDVEDVLATNEFVRAVLGVPIFDAQDRVEGVAWVGLYVPYRFTQTSQARLEALAYRTVAFLESVRLSDQQVAELDRVQDSHRRLQSVIQTMPEAVMVIEAPSGDILASNAAAEDLFGLNRPGWSMRGRRIDQLRITADPPEVEIELPVQQAMRDGVTVTSVELIVTTPTGEQVPVVGSAAPLWGDDDTEFDAVVAVFQDVTPLKEAERLRDEFISVVSHELRSPLTPIRGFAQVVARDLAREGGHENHITYLQRLELQTDRLTRLVDDLLDVSRMRAGRLSVLHEDIDLIEIATATVESKRASVSTHEIVLDTPLQHLPMQGDRDRLLQILDNLVGNAVKYTDGGRVTLGITADDDRIHITISDQGRGIPERDREALFSAFYRTRDANESAVPGLGLGLYIVQELVSAHDGEIHIDEAPGGGARFNIELPRHPVAAIS